MDKSTPQLSWLLAALALLPLPSRAQDGADAAPENDPPAAELRVEDVDPFEAADGQDGEDTGADDPGGEDDSLVEGKPPEELVPLLGHSRYRVREAAEQALRDLLAEDTASVADACWKAYRHHPDPEIRMRARAVLLDYVVLDFGPQGKGFVGIALVLHSFWDAEGDLRFAIKVSQVVPNTPASKGGIKPNDLVTGIDDLDFNQPDADRLFMDYVANKRPGQKVELVLQRDGAELQKSITLMRRPPDILQQEEDQKDPEELFREFRQEREAQASVDPRKTADRVRAVRDDE